MAYTYSFFDDQTVGAEELNRWVSLFVSSGVSDCFADGVPYSLSKLNEIVKNNCTEGVVPTTDSSLSVRVAGQNVLISPGLAFFKDGTVLEITETETLSIPKGKAVYVYLVSALQENRAYPAVSEAEPSGNVVPLAKIDETGAVTDLRRYAKGKVPSFYASDAGLNATKTFLIDGEGDYLLTRGPHTYTQLMLHGRHAEAQQSDLARNLAFFTANLKSGETESLSIRLNIWGLSTFDTDDVIWQHSTSNKVVLYHDKSHSRLYRIEGELITDEDGALWLRVSFNGTGEKEDYLKNKHGIPLNCRVVLA
ncbi:MAG: hypothetical protein IJE10_09005 [Clostridia bacterium]|nr:hypothetical protein [Clostridia bacterium]